MTNVRTLRPLSGRRVSLVGSTNTNTTISNTAISNTTISNTTISPAISIASPLALV
ncbi:MAG: hypothetical protein JWM34_1699 [Ilumatobacteraceae bacterium]|nr:hypothetical protein [Ilumatobacteraceae bacterium]